MFDVTAASNSVIEEWKKKTVQGTSGVAGEFPVLHSVCLFFFLASETICWSEEVGVRIVQCFTGNSLLFLLFEYYASCHHTLYQFE
jgi:hypothetical protein